MQNHHLNFCQCQKISKTLSAIDSRNELLTPCTVVQGFINDFNIDKFKEDLETIFSGFLSSKQCLDYEPAFISELFFYHRINLKLLDDMYNSILLNRIEINKLMQNSKN